MKQSIYGFRQAMPDIFIRRRDRYPRYDGAFGEEQAASITLGNNFRSRREVTGAVNFVFRQLMTRETGGVDYDGREALVPSASYPEREGYAAELLLVDGSTREETDGKDAAEARVIALRLREMKEQLPVFDRETGGTRPLRYGDVCLLLRSKSAHAQAYVDELNRCGVPAWTAAAGGFFSAPEVASAVSLLRAVDNPDQDIPLLSALVSPVAGFLPDELAELRLYDRQSSLYSAPAPVRGGSGSRAGICRSGAGSFLFCWTGTAPWRSRCPPTG